MGIYVLWVPICLTWTVGASHFTSVWYNLCKPEALVKTIEGFGIRWTHLRLWAWVLVPLILKDSWQHLHYRAILRSRWSLKKTDSIVSGTQMINFWYYSFTYWIHLFNLLSRNLLTVYYVPGIGLTNINQPHVLTLKELSSPLRNIFSSISTH